MSINKSVNPSDRCVYLYQAQTLTVDMIKESISRFISQLLPENLKPKHKIEYKLKYRVNLPTDQNNKFRGFGYIFFEDRAVANLFIQDEPCIIETIEKPSESDDELDLKSDSSKGKRWGDIDEFITIKTTIEPPYVIQEDNKVKLCVTRCVCDHPSKNHFPNVLYSKDVPSWITTKFIKDQFSFYASDPDTIHDIQHKNMNVKGQSYPFVYEEFYNNAEKQRKERNIILVFNPRTTDAIYALCMCKVFPVRHHKTKNIFTMKFSHESVPKFMKSNEELE